MLFEINGKKIDFTKALPFAKRWSEWTIGEKRVLDRLGFDLTARDTTRERLTYDDLIALVVYFGVKANRSLTPADVNALTEDEFGKIVLPFVEAFAPRIFPADEPAAESPLPNKAGESASGEQPTPSLVEAGNPETSSG